MLEGSSMQHGCRPMHDGKLASTVLLLCAGQRSAERAKLLLAWEAPSISNKL